MAVSLRMWLRLLMGILLAPSACAETHSADAQAACGSFERVEAELDRRIAGLQPGMTQEQFTLAFGGAWKALAWENPQSADGALFIVWVADGNAHVTDELQCRFDAADKLIACGRECCRSRSRWITRHDYDGLRNGEARSEVEARVCTPTQEWREAADRVRTSYFMPAVGSGHERGRSAYLVFEKGHLVSRAIDGGK